MTRRARTLAPALVALLAAGCGDRAPSSRWPMRSAEGPLALVVRHPLPGDPPPASGRDYVMGSVGTGRATLQVNGTAVAVERNGTFLAYLPVPPAAYRFVARAGSDSQMVVIPVGGVVGMAAAPAPSAPASRAPAAGDVVVVSAGAPEVPARNEPTGDYAWSLLPGTRAVVTESQGALRRLRFPGAAVAWVDGEFLAPARGAAPRITSPTVRVEVHPEETDVVIPAPAPLAWQVMEGESSLALTVYGVREHAAPPRAAGYVARLSVGERDSAALHVGVTLRGPSYGYEVGWWRGAMVLRLRHPPAIDSLRPLAGLAIVVDAGHPPGGATGPTGLAEPIVTLDVARRLATLLASRGARVIMTRTDSGAVSLDRRVAMTRASGAHAFVSIHADAVASGSDPARENGTTVYAARAQAMPLAAAVSRELVARFALPDRGVRQGDYAVVRTTWMPAILCEGATLTIPAQEAALADSTFRGEYALGVANGLETYFRALASSRRSQGQQP